MFEFTNAVYDKALREESLNKLAKTFGRSKRDVMDRCEYKETDAMKCMGNAIWKEWDKILEKRYVEKIDYAIKEYVMDMNDNAIKLDLSDIHEKELMLHFDADKDVKEVEKEGEEMCGEKETICTNCLHLDVCKYKTAYLGYLMAIESVQTDPDWQFAPHASCGHQRTYADILRDIDDVKKNRETGEAIVGEEKTKIMKAIFESRGM